jgi:hypothetical protein
MSAVWSLTVGRATAVDADEAGAAAIGGGAAAMVDGGWEIGWARTVGGGTAGAAGRVAPGTLPVVFFSRDVSFFGMTGMAGTVEGSLDAPPAGADGAAPALEGGTGRGGNVIRTVSFFSVGLLAPPAEGVWSAIVTS